MYYISNYIEEAVIKVDEINNISIAKKYPELKEYRVSIDGDMVKGSFDYHNIPRQITKEEYDTYGITWKHGKEDIKYSIL